MAHGRQEDVAGNEQEAERPRSCDKFLIECRQPPGASSGVKTGNEAQMMVSPSQIRLMRQGEITGIFAVKVIRLAVTRRLIGRSVREE